MGDPVPYDLHPVEHTGSFLPLVTSWTMRRPTFEEMFHEAQADHQQCVMLYPVLVTQGKLTREESAHKLACKAQTVEYLRTMAAMNAPDMADIKAERRNRSRKVPQGWCKHGVRANGCLKCHREAEKKATQAKIHGGEGEGAE